MLNRAGWLSVTLALALGGCGQQSTLDPHSEPARQIATLWWVMLVVSVIVFAGTCYLLVLAWWHPERTGLPLIGDRPRALDATVVAFGIAVPAVSLIALFVYANVSVAQHTEPPAPAETAMTIEVTGSQWWWQVRYPGTTAITANEIHIPVKTRVSIVTQATDVIHSFWVPQLNRKVDSLPGQPNRVEIYADEPGRYRGQCAEFCGIQHAQMGLAVYADTPERFRAWLDNMARPRRAPPTPLARKGEQVFSQQCASCHTIRGTTARGQVGPDLTHLKSRETLGALTIPNRKGYLAGWVLDPQTMKEGTKMPALDLTGPELQALVEYMERLR
ncbi:MAG: cytochrome c oxidase subunit II [Thermoleophilaceae bacterium]|jgi:cytochrome c oxidase subunit 2|nr:cytochrome c oxidase subunit II [Thermoleophilaceae bacterium]